MQCIQPGVGGTHIFLAENPVPALGNAGQDSYISRPWTR